MAGRPKAHLDELLGERLLERCDGKLVNTFRWVDEELALIWQKRVHPSTGILASISWRRTPRHLISASSLATGSSMLWGMSLPQ